MEPHFAKDRLARVAVVDLVAEQPIVERGEDRERQVGARRVEDVAFHRVGVLAVLFELRLGEFRLQLLEQVARSTLEVAHGAVVGQAEEFLHGLVLLPGSDPLHGPVHVDVGEHEEAFDLDVLDGGAAVAGVEADECGVGLHGRALGEQSLAEDEGAFELLFVRQRLGVLGGERHGEQAGPAAVERLRVLGRSHPRPEEEADAAAGAGVILELVALALGERIHVDEVDRGEVLEVELVQRFLRAVDPVDAAERVLKQSLQVEAIALLLVALVLLAFQDENREAFLNLDHGVAHVIGQEAAGFGFGELRGHDVEPIERVVLGADAVEARSRGDNLGALLIWRQAREADGHFVPALAVLEELEAHVLEFRRTRIPHANFEVDRLAARRDPGLRLELENRHVVARTRLAIRLLAVRVGHVDEVNLDPGRRVFGEQLPQRVAVFAPVHGPQIRDDVNHFRHVRIGLLVEHFLGGAEAVDEAIAHGRGLHAVEEALHVRDGVVVEPLERPRLRNGRARLLRRRVVVGLAQVRQQQQVQRLGRVRLGGGGRDAIRDLRLGLIEGGGRLAVDGHEIGGGGRVVEDHDVGRGPAFLAFQGCEPLEPREQHSDEEDEQAAQQQQQQLFEDELPLHPLLGFEQELHGRPLDPPESHPVDQVNDDGGADQRAAGGHRERIGEKGFHSSRKHTSG